MNARCQEPNCPEPATLMARIPMVGDRALCEASFEMLTRMGMDPRRLVEEFRPPWRDRLRVKDLTSRVA